MYFKFCPLTGFVIVLAVFRELDKSSPFYESHGMPSRKIITLLTSNMNSRINLHSVDGKLTLKWFSFGIMGRD